jgi:hypothetical protein
MKIRSLILILALLFADNLFAAECFYISVPEGGSSCFEMESQGDCGSITDDDVLSLNKAHFDRMFFSEDGLASVIVRDETGIRVFYVSREGKTVRTYLFDNGADLFEDGLARTIAHNKFGFINNKLQTVIPPEYDFAFPFRNGHAIVCNHCILKQTEEHKEVTGGSWGIINKKGNPVIPVTCPKEELVKTKVYTEIYPDHL